MSKHNPRNREEAFAYQMEDIVKLMKSLGELNAITDFKAQLKILKDNIEIYEQQPINQTTN